LFAHCTAANIIWPKHDFVVKHAAAHPRRAEYHGYEVARMWLPAPGLSIRRLVRDAGIVPIPRCLPGYRVALSLAQNRASLAIGKRVATAGSFAPGMSVLGQPGEIFDGEMRDRADVLLFLMQPSYVTAKLESRGLPGDRAELRDLPPRLDTGLLECGTLLANALSHGLSGDELYCEILLEAMITRIITRHATLSFGRRPYGKICRPPNCECSSILSKPIWRCLCTLATWPLSRHSVRHTWHAPFATLSAFHCIVTSCKDGCG
jgi:hypothetical protein